MPSLKDSNWTVVNFEIIVENKLWTHPLLSCGFISGVIDNEWAVHVGFFCNFFLIYCKERKGVANVI